MRELLHAALSPESLDIRDDSALHAGHAGARDGAGHYAVKIVAAAFSGQPMIKRHRLIYESVASMMPQEIHALSIDARAPGEP
jgi:BolA family transcriptional regulator, general stress-responsive regulator